MCRDQEGVCEEYEVNEWSINNGNLDVGQLSSAILIPMAIILIIRKIMATPLMAFRFTKLTVIVMIEVIIII